MEIPSPKPRKSCALAITMYLSLRLVVISGFINISNEVGRVKSVSLFFYSFRTQLHICAVPLFSPAGRCAATLRLLFLSNLRARSVSLHRLGVAHQTSLRS